MKHIGSFFLGLLSSAFVIWFDKDYAHYVLAAIAIGLLYEISSKLDDR